MKKQFRINWSASLDFEMTIEANSEEEARDIAENMTLPPYSSREWSDGGAEIWNLEEL